MDQSWISPSESLSQGDLVPQLIEEAHGGSKTALGQLVEHYRRYLHALSVRELPTSLQAKVSASDVVQDACVEACQDFFQFTGRTRFELRAWLRRILMHNLADVARQYQQSAKRQVSREVRLGGGEDDSNQGGIAVARTESPSAQAIYHEVIQQLDEVLAELPDAYRQVILLRSRDRLTFPEIGQKMDRSPDAARKLWTAAIIRLQERLEDLNGRRKCG